MRDSFREFYLEKDDDKIWENSIIVLDTNVLLNLYRYSRATTDQILTLLKKYKDQLWLPHQVALEYQYNRKNVIIEQKDSYKKVCESFNKIPDIIRDSLNEELKDFKKRHKEDIELFINNLRKVSEKQVKELEEKIKHEPDLLEKDFIKENITELFEGKVGQHYDKDKIQELEKQAETRFKNNIPPGYEDFENKNGRKFFNEIILQDKYGDFILWKQIMDYAKEEQVNVIFLTDEQKVDWWYKLKGKVIGPRIELLNEFYFNTKKQFYMFSSIGFIERNKDIVNDIAASEVRELNEEFNLKKQKKEKRNFVNTMLKEQSQNKIYVFTIKSFNPIDILNIQSSILLNRDYLLEWTLVNEYSISEEVFYSAFLIELDNNERNKMEIYKYLLKEFNEILDVKVRELNVSKRNKN
ncbi:MULTISPECIES: PIN-like domain-containing protein [Bacillus]|uniref:PIN-like domain-containing protein n=1 Tax=Bacillus TaxID=1386 RepID=UPI001CDBDD4C|nr:MULTISPECIES: PIN-like domain-containing protein [Bacillus]MEC1540357.1 PIN-like domain-containing protein [Bacillus subtilis]MED3669596.1 PIN-like domain-containing protein [Bacillus subtilis]UQZ56470.1 hypothetical protein C2H96_19250 [Bacillus subtilis]UQZ65153.1 hypothetical protein C2H97_01050 [Bacillus subtilis PY79]UQZ69579.1 hypothetical protein C2I05_03035 [Bacillus subtilis]